MQLLAKECKGLLVTTCSQEIVMKHSSSKPSKETIAANTLILDFLPQSCKGIHFFCVCGTLLWHPQETITGTKRASSSPKSNVLLYPHVLVEDIENPGAQEIPEVVGPPHGYYSPKVYWKRLSLHLHTASKQYFQTVVVHRVRIANKTSENLFLV